MLTNPYQPPGTTIGSSSASETASPRGTGAAFAIAFAIHVTATVTFFVAKAIQWNVFDKMGPGFRVAANISVIAIITMFGSWIGLAAVMLVNGAVWRHWIAYGALTWMIATGLYMTWLVIGMMRFL
jgi:hypothetical protein